MAPKIGEVLAGKYRVERVLGEGGFGVVVAASHLQLRQRVALKFLLPHALRERAIVERFLREARAMASIKSQHVVRVIDIGALPSGAPYLVMEYLEGRDFADIVSKLGPLPVGEAVATVLEACEALAEAHAAGIVHRDLKPANLFRALGSGDVPTVKLLDFGISKLSVSDDDFSLTKSHAMLGSPVYASPEQLRSTKHVDHRSDIWSLGVTLYHLVSGTVPFAGETLGDLAIRVAMDPTPALPRALRIPPDLEAIIRRCLEKNPDARYQSVVELAHALANRGDWAGDTVIRRISKSLGLPMRRPRRTAPLAHVTTTLGGSIGEVSTATAPAGLGRAAKLAIAIAAGLVAGSGLAALALRARPGGRLQPDAATVSEVMTRPAKPDAAPPDAAPPIEREDASVATPAVVAPPAGSARAPQRSKAAPAPRTPRPAPEPVKPAAREKTDEELFGR